MPIDRQLRAALLAKLGVTKQRLSQKVSDMKRKRGPIASEEAAYVIAHLEGIDLSRYLDKETIGHIRGLVPRESAAPILATPAPSEGTRRRGQSVRIAAGLPTVNIELAPSVLQDAKRMSQIYAKTYLSENSVRSVIVRVMTAKHGKDWSTRVAPAAVQRLVEGRKANEAKKPWHGKRAAHEIYYTDFGDLRKIILSQWDDALEPVFGEQQKVNNMLGNSSHLAIP